MCNFDPAGNAPVPYSLNISNVPGPTEPLYFNGARMDGFYPASFLMHGGTLCVLCTSYAGKLVLSLTAASDQLPQAPRIAELAVDAFSEIARVVAVPITS